MSVQTAKGLEVYRTAYALAMRVFRATKSFPAEERWALTGQIRRSSRSVCLNLREAWEKRRYEAHFISKLTDCDGEQRRRHVAVLDSRSAAWAAGLNLRAEQIHQSNETDSSLDFARDCEYISVEEHRELAEMNRSVGRMLGSMINNPAPFLLKTPKV